MADPITELETLLDRWRREVYGNSAANPVPLLTSIAELFEKETEAYLKLPIDPFDDRHPSRTYPESSFGSLLKTLFKNDNFTSALTSDYLTSRSFDLHVITTRLLLDILPGLDIHAVFLETDSLVETLLEWAENGQYPLHSYATGLLGAVMEAENIANRYRDENNQLVPIMLNRLSQITQISSSTTLSDTVDPKDLVDANDTSVNRGKKRTHSDLEDNKDASTSTYVCSPIHNECSSSSWAEVYMSGSYQMHPLSIVMQQRFILQYLSALGSPECSYQELLVHMFEHKALSYILYFIDSRKNQDIRLTFDALKFLGSFLKHKKFALEFLDHGGLHQLLRVNRHGMASSGVSQCLYFLACNEDVMERICWMKRETVEGMVSYGLWLLECSYHSSRAYSAMFFGLCFQFPVLLKLFDRDSGLRKLLNVISNPGYITDDPQQLTDEELLQRRQTLRQVAIALKRYIRAHFVSETRKHTRTNPISEQECKPTSIADENVMEAVELHRQQPMQRFNWRAVERLLQEEGIDQLLKIIAQTSTEGLLFVGKADIERNALDILVVSSLYSKVQHLLLKGVIRTNSETQYQIDMPTLGVIIGCADPRTLDAECQKSALNILINFVSSTNQLRVTVPVDTPGGSRKKGTTKSTIDLPLALRRAIWANNGTLVLPQLLTVTSPLTEADVIRSLAARVLCGLAKDENIRQIMSKLPIFTDGQLQSLMKEPILNEKRIEHAAFRRHCKELIELVTGTPVTSVSGIEPSLAEIRRGMVVNQTKIEFDKTEAYHLIHNYLNSEGFPDVAAAFYKAANLASKPIKELVAPPIQRSQPRSPPPANSNQTICESAPPTPHSKLPVNPNSPGPVHFKSHVKANLNSSLSATNPKSLLRQKSTLQPSQLYKNLNEPSSSSTITLDSIFTEYLRHQHSICKNPVSTCPPFRLLAPHCCPEPASRLSAPLNITSRILKRKIFPPRGGFYGAKYDRQYIYSKFRPIKHIREAVDFRTSSTCCAFSTRKQFLFIGTDAGSLKAFNLNSCMIEASYDCHTTELSHIESSKDDNLLLTTSSASPTCVLWTFDEIFERKHRFDDLHAEFGKATSDKIITTQELFARLWDTTTGSVLQRYEGHHRYVLNRATLNYSDTLVLNDGVLYDVRSPSSIHRFDKFNERINGVFHPNGNEIICNSQVWDLRNFRLLQTVPAFDSCQLKFNSTGEVIFANVLLDHLNHNEPNTAKQRAEFRKSLRTFDSHDYSIIATVDQKRTIVDLAVDSTDEHLALIETCTTARCFHDEYVTDLSVCRLYEIGRPRQEVGDSSSDDDDDDADDEEDDDEDEDEDEEAGLDDYDDEEFEGHVYHTDNEGDLDEDVDNVSGSQLSSSNGSHSIASRDELLGSMTFRRPSDLEDNDNDDDNMNLSNACTSDEEHD